MTTDYQPVSCSFHSELELAIMQRRCLQLGWLEAGRKHVTMITPVDLQTRNGEEFLLATDNNETRYCIRLDRIIQLDVR
ncbi:MAG: transcriptional antiterminator, Rof [Gammaproteobacteria bacterium]|nr:transcriptional antiterminator, Rof [Gammaproteobacteria bacterium]